LTVETDGGLTIISPMAGNESYTFGISTGGVTASKIADNAVTTAKIAAGVVTAAKLNTMSATSGQVLKYNGTAWAPAADAGLTSEADGIIGNEVTNATDNGGLTRSGSGTVAAPYTLGIANNGVTAARIADGAVTAAKLNAMNATSGQVLKYNGTAWAPAADAGLTSETDGVIGNEVTNATTDGGLTRSGSGTVAAPYTLGIANNGVTAAIIADGAVTAAKLNAMSASSGQVLKYNGTAWAPATDAGLTSEADGIIGNEVTNATTDGGLTRSGSGTVAAPYTLGIANNGVTTARIADGAVTAAKLNAMSATAGQALVYDGTAWTPTPLSASAYSGGGSPCPGAIIYNGAYSGPAYGTYTSLTTGGYSASWSPTVFTALNRDLCVAVTDAIISTTTWANARAACVNDWRLPNLMELHIMYKAMGGSGGSTTSFSALNTNGEGGYRSESMQYGHYWSSTEGSSGTAYYFYFASGGYRLTDDKTSGPGYVRCVRSL
jgi:hypothetical protein